MNQESRIRWLHRCIAAGSYPNASRLAERFGISRRQAHRDVDHLRSAFGAPLAYSPERRGFFYTSEFTLPAGTAFSNEETYVETAEQRRDEPVIQMQIPYSAVLCIPDKLARVELRRFIVGEEGRGRFLCEFHSVELFLGVLFCLESEVAILKPAWLRERYVRCAARVLRVNQNVPET